MAGGLRYESFADMPAGMRKQVAARIIENLLPPAPSTVEPEENYCSENCIVWWECNGVAINDECPWRK